MRVLQPVMTAFAVTVMTGFFLVSASDGQEVAEQPKSSPRAPAQGRRNSPIPLELSDEAFDRYLDMLLIGKAWRTQDPSLLTDLGLQLAEGERILLRPHKALNSNALLEVAAYIAGEHDDAVTLERLKKAAKRQDNKTLEPQIKTAIELGMKARVDHPPLQNVESLTPEGLLIHQAALRRIRAARLTGDLETIAYLDKEIDKRPELNNHQQAHLDKVIAKARDAKTKASSSLHSTIKTMELLSDIYSTLERSR